MTSGGAMSPRAEFEPAARGTWPTIARVEATHEAAHALACYLLDVEIHEVRIDRPDDALGHVIHARPVADDRWKRLAITLAPLIHENRCPSWPPSEVSELNDEVDAAETYRECGLSHDDWDRAVTLMTEFLALPSSRRMLTALSLALLDQGALKGEDAFQILKDAEGR